MAALDRPWEDTTGAWHRTCLWGTWPEVRCAASYCEVNFVDASSASTLFSD